MIVVVRAPWLPVSLLLALSLLTVTCLQPDFPYFGQDSGWPLALNQAVANGAVFGRDILFNLGPWSSIYTTQYHPATAGMMFFGSATVALAFALGLAVLTTAWTRWLALLAPLLVATIGLRDPIFVAMPLLLLSVAVTVADDRVRASPAPERIAALLLLCVVAALLSLIKATFGTQAIFMMALAMLALASARAWRLLVSAIATYGIALGAFWIGCGQHLADLPRFFAVIPLLISGYTEGLAKSGAFSDIVAFGVGSLAVMAGLALSAPRLRSLGPMLLLLGTAFTLFVAFKAGFVRHDEHALIAAGTLALVPLTVTNALSRRALLCTTGTVLLALAFVSHHYPSYEWPSIARGRSRLTMAAADTWRDLTDPDWSRRQFDFSLDRIRRALPLPAAVGPSDIYSSGQAILIANGLNWSPRPVLQSVTVTSSGAAKVDLDHLQGTSGHPPVENVFFELENEDNRLPTLQDGLSWPALLSSFAVVSFDRGEQIAYLRRKPGTPQALPGATPLLQTAAQLGPELPLPDMPGGLGWAVLDIRPTLMGRLAQFLFRPPALFVDIRYGNGKTIRYRLLSDLARTGFLLTPPIRDTEDVLELLLPERRAPEQRPVSIAISGESGTRLLWQTDYTLKVYPIDIPLQPDVRDKLQLTPRLIESEDARRTDPADACKLDTVGAGLVGGGPIQVSGITEVDGWIVAAIAATKPPSRFALLFTGADGQTWRADAPSDYRPDVAGYFDNQRLVRSGFKVKLDLSKLRGAYTMTIIAEDEARRWSCAIRQPLEVRSPG